MRITQIRDDGRVNTLRTLKIEQLVEQMKVETKAQLVSGMREVLPYIFPGDKNDYVQKVPKLLPAAAFVRKNGVMTMDEYNGVVMLQVNNLSGPMEADEVKERVKEFPQTYLAFTGSSGKSVKIWVRFTYPDDLLPGNREQAELFHAHAYRLAVKFYQPQLPFDIDFEKDLHIAMDAQIDEGSVVPKYIKLSSPERKSMWTRMFRSGERIPKFIEMINLSLSLIVQLKKKLSVSSVPKTILETYLLQALTNSLDNKELYGLSDYSFKRYLMPVKDDMPMYCAAIAPDQKQNQCIPITRWLIDHDYMKESYDSYEISGCITEHIYYPHSFENAYNELSSAFARILDTFYEMKNYIFKLSLFGLSKEETKEIQIELLKLWKSRFEKCMTEFHNTSNDYSSSECYKFLYEYIKNYRDLDNNLLTKINKLTEEPGNENNKYWATILQKEQEGKAFAFDKELDGKFQLAILLCSAYSTIRSEIPMLKNNDIIQTELEDNNIKRLYDFVLKKESLRNDILQQICKNIFEKSFYFY